MAKTDLSFHAPDFVGENSRNLQNLEVSQLAAVLKIYWAKGIPETFAPVAPKTRTYFRDPDAPKVPLSAKNRAKIAELNHMAWFRAANSDRSISLAETMAPRAPGVAPPPPLPVEDTAETRHARKVDEHKKVIAQLEKAARDARHRLKEMS